MINLKKGSSADLNVADEQMITISVKNILFLYRKVLMISMSDDKPLSDEEFINNVLSRIINREANVEGKINLINVMLDFLALNTPTIKINGDFTAMSYPTTQVGEIKA